MTPNSPFASLLSFCSLTCYVSSRFVQSKHSCGHLAWCGWSIIALRISFKGFFSWFLFSNNPRRHTRVNSHWPRLRWLQKDVNNCSTETSSSRSNGCVTKIWSFMMDSEIEIFCFWSNATSTRWIKIYSQLSRLADTVPPSCYFCASFDSHVTGNESTKLGRHIRSTVTWQSWITTAHVKSAR